MRNSRVDENYSKRGENYANVVIFEQRNDSILVTIIVSFHETFVFLSLLLVFPSIKIHELLQLQSHTFPVEKLL